jgi:hypothetical protein
MKSEKNKGNAQQFSGPTREAIEKQAYFFWLEGGCRDGCQEDNWLRAERYLASQRPGLRQAA